MTMRESAGWPRFGAFSYGLGKDQLPDLIARFSAMGLTGVQLGSDLLDDALAHPETIPATVGALHAAGIETVGLAGYRNLVAADDGRRRENLSYLERCLEVAPTLGASVVATETGTRNAADWQPDPENSSLATKSMLYRALEELLPVAE